MQKAVKAYTDNFGAVKSWQSVAKSLGLSEEEVTDLSSSQQDVPKEQARAMLAKWRESAGAEATRSKLVDALKKHKLTEAASK